MSLMPEILVVDDDPAVRQLLADCLEPNGFSVTSVSYPREALEEIRSRFYNLVLLDLNLPGMSGIELLDHIKRQSPKTEIVIITGNATLKTALEAIERGVLAYVEKPINLGHLVATVNSALEKQRLRLDNEKMIRQLSTLLYVAQDINSELKLDELLRRIVVRVTELVNAESGFVALLEGGVLRAREFWDGQQWIPFNSEWTCGNGVPGHVWETRQPYLGSEADQDELIMAAMRSELRSRSCLCAPMVDTAGQFIGAVEVDNKGGGEEFSLDDVLVLQALSHQAATAIENAQLYERQKEEAVVSSSLLRVAESLSQFTHLNDVLNIAAEITPGLIGCDRFGLFLLDHSKQIFRATKARGRSAEQERRFLSLQLPMGRASVFDEILRRREPIVIEDASQSSFIDPQYAAMFDLTSCLVVPLIVKGDVIGVISFGSSAEPRRFTPRDIKIATGVAYQLAIAIQNTTLFTELSNHKEALQQLSTRLTRVLEEERARISRELHDGLGQILSGIVIGLDLLEETIPQTLTSVKGEIGRIKYLSEQTLEELRRLSRDLRPLLLDDLGLLDALRWLIDYLAEPCGWKVHLMVDDDFPRLPPDIETALYRISQEALNNIKTHAAASQVIIRLSQEGGLVQLEIEDDGCGFDPAALTRNHRKDRGIGLISMRERAVALDGSLVIESRPGSGTKIKVLIPAPSTQAAPAMSTE